MRAAKPSKKSITAAIKTKSVAETKWLLKIKIMAKHPHNKLRQVKKLGICFLMLLIELIFCQK